MLESTATNSWFEIILQQGRNQQIRRMFDLVGHSVVKLRRVRIGSLDDRRMKPGTWRLLQPHEVKQLMRKSPPKQGPEQQKTRRAGHGSSRR